MTSEFEQIVKMASPVIGNTSKQTPECSDSEESSLCLSCGSSPFDEDQESETNEATGNFNSVQINPYQFEPYASRTNSSTSSSDENENDDRLTNNSW